MSVQAELSKEASLVASLAADIARELGLTPSETEGILLGALLHDIGLLALSARVLQKPRRLSESEYALVCRHCAIGCDLISGIPFPWPVKRAVLEHHERWNGSGYPNGLKSKAICLEARIIAVADVVIAMACDRPYRPAIGLDAAKNEILLNLGRLYDPDVAHVCAAMLARDHPCLRPDDAVQRKAHELWERVRAHNADRNARGRGSSRQAG